MALTAEETRERIQAVLGGFAKRTPLRLAYLGDGRGQATSNLLPPDDPTKIYARETLETANFFKTVNRFVRPAFDLPVILGFNTTDPFLEQVLDVNFAAFGSDQQASALGGAVAHHTSHEFGGGDEVFIEGRLFTPGLVRPTTPKSMQVVCMTFVYFFREWREFKKVYSINFTEFVPAADVVFALVALDPHSEQLVYRFGPNLSGETIPAELQVAGTLAGFDMIPPPGADEYPLGIIRLEAGMTAIDWASGDNAQVMDARLHINTPQRHLIDRVERLEQHIGSVHDLPATGAASRTGEIFPREIDGGMF